MFEFSESEENEFKSSFNNDTVTREIVAFLNAHGGRIFIGVNNDKTICGVRSVDETQRKISDIITNQIEPLPTNLIKTAILTREDKEIVEITVMRGFHALYCIKKYGFSQEGCPVRIGSTTKEMPVMEIEMRYKKRFESSNDYMTKRRAAYGDITFTSLKIALSTKGFHINDDSFAINYNLLMENGEYNQLAELLSDKNNLHIIFAKFRGKDKSSMSERNDFGRQSVINSYFALKTRLQAENVCMVDTTIRPRKETYLYDMDAVDEAIINAFVHNDWNISEPLFCMFDDRLEILSYGGMPYSQTKERFLQGISVPRNLSLMRVFQDLEITEKTGHGTVKIISAYGKEAFDIQDGFIQVTIPFSKKVMKNRGTLNGTLNGTLKNDNLTNNELALLGIFLSDPSISLSDAGDRMGISRRTVSRIVASLQDKGIVERKGSKKRGSWKIVK